MASAKDVKERFSKCPYQSWEQLDAAMNELCSEVRKADRGALLYGNAPHLQAKTPEGVILQNLPDRMILSALDISVFDYLTGGDPATLCGGLHTYARLRHLNRWRLSGAHFNTVVESYATGDKVMRDGLFKSSGCGMEPLGESETALLGNFVKAIRSRDEDSSGIVIRQWAETAPAVTAAFDKALYRFLAAVLEKDAAPIEGQFGELCRLHNRCGWIVRGWYRESTLIQTLPMFLAGLCRLAREEAGADLAAGTGNPCLDGLISCLDDVAGAGGARHMRFTGDAAFLNRLLEPGVWDPPL